MLIRSSFAQYSKLLREFIQSHSHGEATSEGPCPAEIDRQFEQLALELLALQFQHNSAYRQICQGRDIIPERIGHWPEIPSVPAIAFKEWELDITIFLVPVLLCINPIDLKKYGVSTGTIRDLNTWSS